MNYKSSTLIKINIKIITIIITINVTLNFIIIKTPTQVGTLGLWVPNTKYLPRYLPIYLPTNLHKFYLSQ